MLLLLPSFLFIILKMSNANDFQDKATRLMNKLTFSSSNTHHKHKYEHPKISIQDIHKIKQDYQLSDAQSCKKMKGLGDSLKKLEGILVEQGQARVQKEQTFNQTITKLQKNMKVALNNVQKGFIDREKKLEQKLDALIRNEKKQLETRVKDNEQLLQQMNSLDAKITTIAEQVTSLRRARAQLEDRIIRQFAQQLKELKKIFENDIRSREERQVNVVQTLKNVYKGGMQRIYSEEKEREEGQKMLMAVIEQLVEHIIQA